MRQKDVNKVAEILENELSFADDHEIDGLCQAVGAISRSVGWAQPDLDMGPLERLLPASEWRPA